ncbi:MAG: hypothetical protein JXB08_03545 [Bacilli bacterium]|nr:hypothetical protein [Bacilli bacterium]MBN2877160.1 hypothetical protein [Bacilli bacterium]
MKNNIMKNIQLDRGEKIFKDFRKMNAKGYTCQILMTTRRLVIFSSGRLTRGKNARVKKMNEISLKAINRTEYYIETVKNNIWVRLIGFLMMLGALYAGYLLYMGRIPVPASIPFQPYIKYVAVGAVVFITLLMMFVGHKTLYFDIYTEGNRKPIINKLNVNKYNEVAIRYLVSKVQTI